VTFGTGGSHETDFRGVSFLLWGSLALAAGSVSYSLDIDMTPGNQAGTYLCKAVVTDLVTGGSSGLAPLRCARR
jgi:hypothetical protein